MNSSKYLFFILILFISVSSCRNAQKQETSSARTDVLKLKIEQIIRSKKATVGVGIIGVESPDTLIINGEHHYPMQSTYKFHLALAILNQVDSGKYSLDQLIHIEKDDLLPDTHSPLRDLYPEGNVDIPLREILIHTVSKSDNNGCDILFRLAGGAEVVNRYIQRIGINGINIVATEEEMHSDWDVQFANWTTPLASAELLGKFYGKQLLSTESQTFLWDMMAATSTGAKRIRGLIPDGTEVAHKTGSGPRKDQIASACNDIGIVTLPDGKHFIITVYITDSKESDEVNDQLIAEISKAVWDFYVSR